MGEQTESGIIAQHEKFHARCLESGELEGPDPGIPHGTRDPAMSALLTLTGKDILGGQYPHQVKLLSHCQPRILHLELTQHSFQICVSYSYLVLTI